MRGSVGSWHYETSAVMTVGLRCPFGGSRSRVAAYAIRLLQCRQLSAGERGSRRLPVELDGGKLVPGFSTGVASHTMAEDAGGILDPLGSDLRHGRGQTVAEQVQRDRFAKLCLRRPADPPLK